MRKPQKYVKDIGFFFLILLLVLVVLFSGLRILESTVLSTVTGEEVIETKTIYRGDKAYFPRQDITTILLLGIDRYGPVVDSETYNNRGAADMAMVVSLDHAGEECRVLQLNREGIQSVSYRDTEHYQITAQFLSDPERMLRYLFEEEEYD